MRWPIAFIVAATVTVAHGADSPAPVVTAPAPPVPTDVRPRAAVLRLGDADYELGNSSVAGNVETDEYVPVGETLAHWTRLVTVQRLKVAVGTAAADFVAYFRRSAVTDGATLDVIHDSRAAVVFVVRFPPSVQNEEQVMVCLAFIDPAKPTLLNVLQYAVKPAGQPGAAVEAGLRAWKDKYLLQARELGGADATKGPGGSAGP